MPRPIPKISLRDFAARRAEIGAQILDAAENVGFFILVEQESPSRGDIEEMFELSTKFFALPDEIKGQWPFIRENNTGWERDAQVRPSTGVADPKESLQLQWFRRTTYWPHALPTLPDFEARVARFHAQVHELSMQILGFFAGALGWPEGYFREAHDLDYGDALSTLRLLRYHAQGEAKDGAGASSKDGVGASKTTPTTGPPPMRAGAHADFDVLTLLFQQTGGDGLEVLPGREAHGTFDTLHSKDAEWTPVPAQTGEITVNIGDMLMSWSDDRFKSLIHRVRMPTPEESGKARNSMAYFTQPRPQVIIQGPTRKYAPMTAQEYILSAMRKYYKATQGQNAEDKVQTEDSEKTSEETQTTEKAAPLVAAAA
uniref:Fe2OG dioxygenase domain-containing protein n=1 Tax=Schizophyllum commune (strain H4-8 / FGSC 9210) TaxID=578458 RepID=D8PQ95_SCHCM